MSAPQFVVDLSVLPKYGHGARSLTWWGMMGLVAIESTVFVLAVGTYFYLMAQVPQWPPSHPPPRLTYGTTFTVVLLLSLIPNIWLKRKAEHENLSAVRIGLVIMSVIGVIAAIIRAFEFTTLNVTWYDNAYGSIVLVLLGLHTVHVLTDLYDTIVLTVLMFTSHAQGRRFVDTAENAIYWYFVVYAWLPIYLVLYFVPRWK
jgi:heme/copper-type cytochrome/quinol oxidase subunit 3